MRLPTTTWGRGPTRALFLHGFTGNRETFHHLEPLLGDVVTATSVDLPGHHEAPLPSAEGAMGFAQTIDGLVTLLTEPTVLVGYSQGARLALAVAARAPHLVERLVLESGSPGLRRRRDRFLRRQADEALAQSIVARGVEPFLDDWERQPLFHGLARLPESQQAALRRRRSTHRAEGLAGALRCLGQGVQPALWPSLVKLRLPTLVLSGARDAKYTRLARRMTTDLPLGWRVTFDGVGHAPHLECPEAYAAELRAFLASPWQADPVELVP